MLLAVWQQQDQLGRTTLLSSYIPGGGQWTPESGISFDYDAADRLTRQTGARDKTSCLYYGNFGRMRRRVQRTDDNCAATVAESTGSARSPASPLCPDL